jgi:hypothetical protein
VTADTATAAVAAEADWGLPTCFNETQDADEDGIDCCLTSGACQCNAECA